MAHPTSDQVREALEGVQTRAQDAAEERLAQMVLAAERPPVQTPPEAKPQTHQFGPLSFQVTPPQQQPQPFYSDSEINDIYFNVSHDGGDTWLASERGAQCLGQRGRIAWRPQVAYGEFRPGGRSGGGRSGAAAPTPSARAWAHSSAATRFPR